VRRGAGWRSRERAAPRYNRHRRLVALEPIEKHGPSAERSVSLRRVTGHERAPAAKRLRHPLVPFVDGHVRALALLGAGIKATVIDPWDFGVRSFALAGSACGQC
jgi:hypothetical protein